MRNFKIWVKAAGIRALKTVAQTAVAMLPVAAAITEVDWLAVVGTAVLAGITSILTSIAGLPEVKTQTQTETETEGENDNDA